MYDTILIPTGGSEPANRAAEHGFELANQHDATVHILYVVELTEQVFGGVSGGTESGMAAFDQEVLPAIREEGQETTDRLAERAAAFDLDATTALREGYAPNEIHTYVDEQGIDLIVMGTHGRSGVKRVLLGSVTERVTRTSDVPVLVIQGDE